MYKALFVVSGNSKEFDIAPFIKRQGDSLEEIGCKIDYYSVKGKRIKGYLKNIKHLKNIIKLNNYDIIHAHYTFNGLLSLLTFSHKPLVVSYMGTDTYGDYSKDGKIIPSSYINILISKIIQPFTNAIIVKSPTLKK